MSYAVSGVYSKVLTGSVDMDVTGGTFDVETTEIDTTTTSDGGWEDSIDGPKKVSGSFDFFWNPSKNPFSAVQKLNPGASATVFPTLKLYIDDTNFATGTARITKLSKKSATKEGVMFTASFVSKGAWTLPGA